MKASRLGRRARKTLRMTDGMKLVMSPLMTGRFATALKPGVLSSLLTCQQVNKASQDCGWQSKQGGAKGAWAHKAMFWRKQGRGGMKEGKGEGQGDVVGTLCLAESTQS